MTKTIRLLLVEDRPHDAELLVRALTRSGFTVEWKRVDNEDDFLARLADPLDLILSDYDLPQFNGLRALELVRARGVLAPFILVSGTIGEETAVAAMQQGAADYLMKDRLARLGNAVERALAEAESRRERVRTAAALRESEERLKLALVASSMGVWEWNVRTNEVIWTPECYEIMGIADFAGTLASFERRLHPEDHDRVMREVAHAVATRTTLDTEFRLVNAEGQIRWIRNLAQTSYDAFGHPLRMVGTMANISVRKRAEAELAESQLRFRQVVENIQEVFWMSDTTTERLVYVSPGYEEIWGRTRESLYADRQTWVESIHPQDRMRVLDAVRTKQRHGTYDETYRIVRPDGTRRWVHDKAFLVRDAGGNVTRIVGVAEDVTKQRELEEQFLRSQRIEAIGTLASGIAHDLNNILAPMLMLGPLLKGKLREPHDRELVVMMEQGVQRGAGIVKQLLTFSRGIEGERGPVQLRHLVKEMTAIMRETFPREITVVESVPNDLWLVSADATQLHQVLLNLCVNARDALRGSGRLTVTVRNEAIMEAPNPHGAPPAPGPYVCLTVADTGEGIAPENIDRIFEPFFTTKEFGKGNGLGLSTAVGIVKSHGGFISVESTPGKGSCFTVHLPALLQTDSTVAPSAPAQMRGNGETILVVDDEVAIRHTLRIAMESNHYRVLLAGEGQEALRQYHDHQGEVRLVLTDMMMPGMNGRAFLQVLRQLAPTLPVIAMTGLFELSHREELAALGVTRILAKPCDISELLAAIHNQLAESK